MTNNVSKDSADFYLRPGETVVWKGGPVFKPFVISALSITLVGILMLIIPSMMLIMLLTLPSNLGAIGTTGFVLFLDPFFLVGLAMIFSPLYYARVHRYIEYVLTDKRIIITGGLVGRDIKIINLDQIKNVAVNVGLVDSVYGTGKIRFFTGEIESSGRSTRSKYNRFHAVKNPYDLFKLIEDRRDQYRLSK